MANTARQSDGGSAPAMNSYIKKYCDFLSQNTADLATATIADSDIDDVVVGGATASEIAAVRLAPDTLSVTPWIANAAGAVLLLRHSQDNIYTIKLVMEQMILQINKF